MNPPTLPPWCARKRRWLTRADARRAARKLERSFRERYYAYPCEFCNYFHVGSAKDHTRAEHREYHSPERHGQNPNRRGDVA